MSTELVPYDPNGKALPAFTDDDFLTNPEPRCPVVLVLDRSSSMHGARIAGLNAGLSAFETALKADPLARKRAEISTVTFGPVAAPPPFVTADRFSAPQLLADGDTPMGAALAAALDLVETRLETYRTKGVPHYRPIVVLLTDGEPTDPWSLSARRVRALEEARRLVFFAVGVEGADMAVLRAIAHPQRPPRGLDGLKFVELFVWLSSSVMAVSRSQPGDQVALPPTDGWAAL